MRIVNSTKDSVLGDRIELAGRSKDRTKGLLGRSGLDEGEGLWIKPCEAIHMFFMKFAIDAVFIDKRHRVTKVVSNLKPWRLAGSLGAHSVIELPAGAAERSRTEKGDQLAVEQPAPRDPDL